MTGRKLFYFRHILKNVIKLEAFPFVNLGNQFMCRLKRRKKIVRTKNHSSPIYIYIKGWSLLFDDDKLYKKLINFHETTVYISNLKK